MTNIAKRLVGRRPGHRGAEGQSIVELSLLAPVLIVFFFGVSDWGLYYVHRLSVAQAVRYGARYAATHPTAYSTAATAPANTIPQAVQSQANIANLRNQAISGSGAGIGITYYDPATTPATQCGYFDYTVGAPYPGFHASGSYTQTTCLVAGHLIKVQVNDVFQPATPVLGNLMPGGVTISDSTTVLEEQ